MKILIACIPTSGNRYLIDLKKGLEDHAYLVWNADAFWKCEDQFDVVHIHWPEYLSYGLEAYLSNHKSIDSHLWKRLKQCLLHWSKHSKIILTRHNDLPHSRKDKQMQDLYKLIYKHTAIVIHFANYSIQQFKQWYPELDHIKHVVIPHHNYASLPNHSTRHEARKHLQIASDTHVMLVFGGIKENEKPLIKKAFKAISNKNKVLLAPGWKIPRRPIQYIRLREWVWNFETWFAKQKTMYRFNLGFIKEEEAHYYLNAADFLFIPRTNELNSGNITLGFTFGLVVVGKDTADIGEILKETGNPTFTVGDDESLENAIYKAYEMKQSKHGEQNKALAFQEWSIKKVTKAYWDEMTLLLKNTLV